jgi:hypothetical protein
MTSLERFVKRLVQVLEAGDPTGIHRPVSVADLRTEIMPYRTNRVALGLTNNDDYELLVIRLVAEEGDYVRTNPTGAAELARTEAGHSNPNLDLVEDLADVTLQIGAEGLARIAAVPDQPDSVAPAEAAPSLPDEAPSPAPAESELLPKREIIPRPEPEPEFEPLAETIDVEAPIAAEPPPHQLDGTTCRSCHLTLPEHRSVAFCPFCGTRQGTPRCSKCGSEIEAGWRHCITCGYLVPPGAFA